jgi:hypothetical protein
MPNMDCYKGKQKQNQNNGCEIFEKHLSEKLEGTETEIKFIEKFELKVRKETITMTWPCKKG